MEVGVTLERAIELTSSIPLPYSFESIPLTEARGRITSAPLHSMVDDPRFDNSAMDGFAVRATDCDSESSTLSIVGISQAGNPALPSVGVGEACRIMTGAKIPPGADAIVMIEDTEIEDNVVTVTGPARPGFIRKQGENFRFGDQGLPAGTLLTPSRIAMAAAMGHSEIQVVKKPKVAVISTGDELYEPGEPLTDSGIYESNTKALVGMLEVMGCEATNMGIVEDNESTLRLTLDKATEGHDLIITSGGVSMGEWDLIRKLMENEGDISFWRIKIKPGGPPLFGTWKGTPLFGLPGNPVSSQLVFLTVVAPYLTHSFAHDDKHGPSLAERVHVKLTTPLKGTPNKLTMRRLNISSTPQGLVANAPNNQGSGNVASMVECNGLSLLPAGSDGSVGDTIEALWLNK